MKTSRKTTALAVLMSTALLFGSNAMADGDKHRKGKGDHYYKPHKEHKHKPAHKRKVEKHVYHHYDDDFSQHKRAKKWKHHKKHRKHHYGKHYYGHKHGHGHRHAKRYDYRDRYGYYDDHDGRIRFSISYYDWF
jgi:hypothetical protein